MSRFRFSPVYAGSWLIAVAAAPACGSISPEPGSAGAAGASGDVSGSPGGAAGSSGASGGTVSTGGALGSAGGAAGSSGARDPGTGGDTAILPDSGPEGGAPSADDPVSSTPAGAGGEAPRSDDPEPTLAAGAGGEVSAGGAGGDTGALVAVCGDGLAQAPEECDDGNDVSSDACTRTCTIAKCGDHSVWKDKEECDGGVGCTADCRLHPVELTLGMRHSCARYDDGRLKCWGDNSMGQVGDTADSAVGDEPSDLGKNLATLLTGVASVNAGAFHTCALKDGAVLCWGDNRYNQLGPTASGSWIARPVQVDAGGPVRDVCATAYSSFALLQDGTVRGWGLSYANDERGIQSVPFSEDLSVDWIACGNNAVCGLAFTGEVECWGDAPLLSGQPEPLRISLRERELTRVSQLAIGSTHGCAFYEQGLVRCWGSNRYGQLLEGDTLDRPGDLPANEPWHQIKEGMLPIAIAAGSGVSCAIGRGDTVGDSVNEVKCWGFDSRSGALGQPQLTGSSFNPIGDAENEIGESLFPIALGDGDNPQEVATSGYHTCVILQNGGVKCWGHNEFGQLGIGTTEWAIGDQEGELGNALRYSLID